MITCFSQNFTKQMLQQKIFNINYAFSSAVHRFRTEIQPIR